MTDLHYGEKLELDINTTRLMKNLIRAESPDFLSFTGDMVAGWIHFKWTFPFSLMCRI